MIIEKEKRRLRSVNARNLALRDNKLVYVEDIKLVDNQVRKTIQSLTLYVGTYSGHYSSHNIVEDVYGDIYVVPSEVRRLYLTSDGNSRFFRLPSFMKIENVSLEPTILTSVTQHTYAIVTGDDVERQMSIDRMIVRGIIPVGIKGWS